MENGPNSELDFNGLLMHHLDRLSHLLTLMAGDVLKEGGVVVHYRDNDRADAFAYGVRFLQNLIPDNLKTDEYKKEEERIKSEKKGDSKDLAYNLALFHNAINLLHWVGLLMPEDTIGGPDV